MLISNVRTYFSPPQKNASNAEDCTRLKASNSKDSTRLKEAIDEGNIEDVRQMQKNGVPLHELKIDGKSAHEYAKDDDEPEIAELLLKKPDCSDLESSQPLRL